MADVIDYIKDGPLDKGPPIPVVLCDCGREVECWFSYNECEGCEKRAYNGFGQELRPPQEWTDYELEMGYDN